MSDANNSGRNFSHRLGIFANFAVVGGIIFLGVEIRQNSQMMKAQIRSDLTQSVIAQIEIGMRPEVAAAQLRRANGEDALPEDQYFLDSYVRALLRGWENSFYQYRMGLFDRAEYEADLRVLEAVMQTALYVNFWDRYGGQFSDEFRQTVEGLKPDLR